MTTPATVQLSGYLGGDKTTNVPGLAEALADAFEKHRANGGHDAVLLPVVGLLRVETVRHHRDPDHGPTVALRFAALEAASDADATAVRDLWQRLHDHRVGDTIPLDLDWTGRGPTTTPEPDPGPGDGDRYDPTAAPTGSDQTLDDPGAAPGGSTTAVDFSGATTRGRTPRKRRS